jgi:hypothetical protein
MIEVQEEGSSVRGSVFAVEEQWRNGGGGEWRRSSTGAGAVEEEGSSGRSSR